MMRMFAASGRKVHTSRPPGHRGEALLLPACRPLNSQASLQKGNVESGQGCLQLGVAGWCGVVHRGRGCLQLWRKGWCGVVHNDRGCLQLWDKGCCGATLKWELKSSGPKLAFTPGETSRVRRPQSQAAHRLAHVHSSNGACRLVRLFPHRGMMRALGQGLATTPSNC